MSRCGKTDQLEALAMGELSLARATELEVHTAHCAVCHHELNWLKSERLMFEQRLAREHVSQLWEGFAQKRAAPARRQRAWGRLAMAIAASTVLMLGLSAKTRSEVTESASLDAPMSLEEMSRETRLDCSALKPGVGFACGPYLPASFAQRE